MIPGNVDPRRPEKVQRYKPPQANGNPPAEDLTPDYMNILGPVAATANAEAGESVKSGELQQQTEDPSASVQESMIQTSNGTNVIPTSPQYGVAIMSGDVLSETTTLSTDTVIETTAKTEGDNKDMHSTPSRNDRFKVVKIASLEPFRRGRWKCMDYVDENPPPATTGQPKTAQSATNLQMGGNLYLQTQSLPQQHFQQMLVQGAFANPQQFYQNLPSQMIPQSQYFYPAPNVTNIQSMPVQPNAIQPQFMNANQQYFPTNVVPHSAAYTNYTNVQYVPSNLIQNQNSAFVPTTQNVNPQLPPNFQQSQTYAGPPSTGAQPMVNGHAFTTPSEQPQVVASSLPTQVAKNVLLNANQTIQGNIVSGNPIPQSQVNQQYNSGYPSTSIPPTNTAQNMTQVPPVSTVTPIVPVGSTQSVNPSATTGTIPSHSAMSVNLTHMHNIPHNYDPNLPTNVYTNPQFVASVNSIPVADTGDTQGDSTDANPENENMGGEDPAKSNPVVNAIDNKIEQAMDLVKSHLMYTVREEVEVLKEKIAELMERIQQLETENNFLKQQIPQKGLNSGMIFSMCGLMMRLKWCAWVALYCSCISFANSRLSDDTKQILSSFMLSISAIVMSYLQNPQPMTPPWAATMG